MISDQESEILLVNRYLSLKVYFQYAYPLAPLPPPPPPKKKKKKKKNLILVEGTIAIKIIVFSKIVTTIGSNVSKAIQQLLRHSIIKLVFVKLVTTKGSYINML